MSFIRPTQRARWAWGGAATLVQPPSGSAEAGFATEQRPPAQWFNWQWNTIGQWIDFLAGPDVENWTRYVWPGDPAANHFDNPSRIAFAIDTDTSDSSSTAAAFRYVAVGDRVVASATESRMWVSQRGNSWETRDAAMPSGVTGPYAIRPLATGRWLLGCLSSLGVALVYYGETDNGTARGPLGAEGNTWTAATPPGSPSEVKAFAHLSSSANVVAACAAEAMYSADFGVNWTACTFSGTPSGAGLDVVSDGLKYVWVSADGEVYNSTDGVTFTDVATLAPGAASWRLCAGDAREVLAYRIGSSSSADLYLSTDSGASWTAVTQTGDAPKRITSVAYKEGTWIVTGSRSPWMWVSNDLAAWRTLTLPTESVSDTAIPPALYSVQWDGRAWVAVGNGVAFQCGRAADPSDGVYVASDTPSTLSDAGSLRGALISTTAPTNGQVLTYNSTSGLYVPATPSGSSSPTTTRGDIIRRGASADERLAALTADTFVGGDGTDVAVRTAAQVQASINSASRIYLPATPILRWKCSETSGSTLANSGSSSSADLTITGSPDVGRPTEMGRAVSWTGDATGPAPTEFAVGAAAVAPTSPMTILAWCRARAFTRAFAKIIYRASREPWAAPTGHGLRLAGGGEAGTGSGGWVAEVSIGGSTISVLVSTARHYLVAGRWHLVALTHDGTDLRAYLDGLLVGSASASGSLDNGSTGTRQWMLGANGDASVSSECWDGEIREAQVYSSTLSASDLRTIYERGVGSAGVP